MDIPVCNYGLICAPISKIIAPIGAGIINSNIHSIVFRAVCRNSVIAHIPRRNNSMIFLLFLNKIINILCFWVILREGNINRINIMAIRRYVITILVM